MVKKRAEDNREKKLQRSFKVHQVQFSILNQEALKYELNQTLQRHINNIVTSKSIPLDGRRYQLKQQVLHIFKETALNEVQATVWALLLERLVWNNSHFSLWFKFLASALYSKEYLGESLECLIKKYSDKDDKFAQNYQLWREYCQKIDLTVREINQKYNEINIGKIDKLDYNFYVDDIILSYQPYQTYIKRKKHELEEDSDFDFFAEIDPVPAKRKRRIKIKEGNDDCVRKISGLLNLDI